MPSSMSKTDQPPFKHVFYRPKTNIRLNHQSTPKHQTSENRIKFTVIGNIVTKEFMYCMHLVTKLHKYRPKQFLAPVIRGVTSVEWPTVRNDLKIQYDVSEYCIKSEVAVLICDNFLGCETDLKEFVESRYVCPLRLDYYKEGIQQLAYYINSFGRPCVYLHISINGDPIGTMIFMLYSDIVPKTCENFLRLCHATKDGYSGTPIHRIVKDSWIQCAGFNLKSNKELGCENFDVPHDKRGVLCMANNGRHIDCSTQFFVLLQPAPWMKHKYVAFGQLIEGERTLRNIENVPTSHESPNAEIIIYKSGTFDINLHPKPICKHAKEYINGHIEDLVTAGEIFYEAILEETFKEIDNKRMKPKISDHQDISNVRPAKSFLISGDDINRQSQSQTDGVESLNASGSIEATEAGINECEFEEYTNYDQVTTVDTRTGTSCSAIKPNKVFYIPLTDTEVPGEVNSTFEMQKLLRGDYCLESDLQKENNEQLKHIPEEVISAMFEGSENSNTISENVSNYTDEEIKAYIKKHMDTVSFGGPLIKKIADGNKKFEIFKHIKGEKNKIDVITDEELRLIRVARNYNSADDKKKIVHTSSSSIYGIGKTDSMSDLWGPITGFINCGEEIDFSVHEMTSNIFSRNYTPSEDSTGSRIRDPELCHVPSRISSSILNTQRAIVSDELSPTSASKKRPSLTVTEYQKKNQLHEVNFKNSKSMKMDNDETAVMRVSGTSLKL